VPTWGPLGSGFLPGWEGLVGREGQIGLTWSTNLN
jgi:hypothetical protein